MGGQKNECKYNEKRSPEIDQGVTKESVESLGYLSCVLQEELYVFESGFVSTT
jgi:hypothetical protein